MFTADESERCYIASLQCAAELLGIQNYLPDICLEIFFTQRGRVITDGVTWQDLTKLMQLCNARQKKAGRLGIKFGGKKKKVNLIRGTYSGAIDLALLNMTPGVYLCGVSTAIAGHMFVINMASDGSVRVHDSIEGGSQAFKSFDFRWVHRWLFIRPCFVGHF